MSWWTVLWIAWGLYFAIVEGVALFNSRTGDTLSEHVWAFAGRRSGAGKRPATVRRTAVGLFMLALSVHFLIGSDPTGNAALIVASVTLAIVALAAFLMDVVQRHRRARLDTSSQDPSEE